MEEESWNAYPYTRTIYRCPFVDKFSLDVETYYIEGTEIKVILSHLYMLRTQACIYVCVLVLQNNVFNLKGAELKNRVIG